LNKRILAGYALVLAALVLVPAAPYGPLYFGGLWARTPLGLYLGLAVVGLLAVGAVVGVVWSERLPVRILRLGLLVVGFLVLLAGTVIVDLAWFGVGMSSRYGGGFARFVGIIGFWPAGVLTAWLLGSMALLSRRRYWAAVVYTASALATIAAVTLVTVGGVQLIPFLVDQGWIVALFILVVSAIGVYAAWRSLFRVDFIAPKRAVTPGTGRAG
jgi:hypothetical protein